tara:strand:- start:51 stop:635 length:585 start_codon:yes stop_codon:yes gene_type:complete
MYRNFLKDIFDFYLAIILFLFFFPLMIFIFLVLYILIGSPIYTQKRPGYLNESFIIFKFKTLIDKDCKNFKKNKNTFKFGTFLRKTGIDEIPQLLNILKGEMSFIGPRPLLFEYLKKYSNKEKKRHLVKPGITGLAQVNPDPSGNKIWKKSIKLDLYYVKEVSFILDMKIVLKTIGIILLKKKQYKDFKKFYEK